MLLLLLLSVAEGEDWLSQTDGVSNSALGGTEGALAGGSDHLGLGRRVRDKGKPSMERRSEGRNTFISS